MLGKEACGGKRCHGIRAQSFHRQGLLRQQAAAAGQAKQPQIRSGAGKCRLRLFAEPGNDPVGGAAQTFDGVAQSSTRVSSFMRNIDASQWLRNPELEVVQTGKGTGPGSSFTLTAEQVSATPQESGNAAKTKLRKASLGGAGGRQ